MRACAILLAATLGLAGLASAQDEQTVSLGRRTYDVFELNSSPALHVYSFSLGNTAELVIDVHTPVVPVGVTITRPDSTVVDPATFGNFNVAADDVPPLGSLLFEAGRHVQAVISAPPAGLWTISVALPIGSPPTTGSITTVANGAVAVGAITSRPYYQAGESVVLALLAFDGPSPVTGAIATANLYQTGSETIPLVTVPLRDDGAEPDAATGDGVYTAAIDGLAPGHYLVEVTVQYGTETATAGVDFEVIAALGRFDGTRSDAGVDANADGLYDFIRLDFGVSIQTPGTYDVFAELTAASGGNGVRAGKRAALAAGTQTVSLLFSASDIRKYLLEDGPWKIKDLLLVKISTDSSSPDRLVDRVRDPGFTNSYTLSSLQRPITIILQGITEDGVDTNGNGRYDLLPVSFQVDTRSAGFYTWTGSLRAANRIVLGVASGQGSLPVGVTAVTFTFDGLAIGASGLDGPYTVEDLAVYGPIGAAAVVSNVGQTRAYHNWQFEGGIIVTLDVDGSDTATKYDALTDGLLVVRYLFGLTGSSLTTSALGGTATRTDPAAVKGYLDSIRTKLDIDGDGKADGVTDGVLIVRYLFGLRGNALIAGALDPLATRTTAADIEAYLQTLMP